ncbi:hypothetical protein MTO96_011661 [Rhipicephalus appendiculatus]
MIGISMHSYGAGTPYAALPCVVAERVLLAALYLRCSRKACTSRFRAVAAVASASAHHTLANAVARIPGTSCVGVGAALAVGAQRA